jgi:ectoine hydroxylase-related dioxygenase (phytanoyl-CoA dioxygenase family)
MSPASFAKRIAEHGWATTGALIGEDVLAPLERELAPHVTDSTRGGVRNLFAVSPLLVALARSATLRSLATPVLGERCAAVRVIYFDKTPDANWRVPWHQDLTVAAATRADVEGYGPWSEKDGVPHVQPPVAVLEDMLAVRVHLDASDATNGPVRVLPGSHLRGLIAPAEIDEWRDKTAADLCLAPRGGIVAFRPLILHASSPAERAAHRRVIHIEYTGTDLAAPLRWHTQIRAASVADRAGVAHL